MSLLIHEGIPLPEVARRAGHSQHTCLETYSHVFDEYDPSQRVEAETAIRQARDRLVRSPFAPEACGG